MSKVPVSTSPHSKPNTASSAWTRLIQITKTASKTPRNGDAKSPGTRRQSPPTSIPSMAQSSRSAKRRRVNGPQKPQSAPRSTPKASPIAVVPLQDADHTENLSRPPAIEPALPTPDRAELGQVGVRSRPGKEQWLPKHGRGLSPSTKRKSASIGVPTSSPTHADLRVFWGPRVEESQSSQDEWSQENGEVEPEKVGKESTCSKTVEDRKTLVPVDENSEHDMEDELPRQSPEQCLLDNAGSGAVHQTTTDIIDTAVRDSTRRALTGNARATGKEAARLSTQFKASRGGYRTRRRSRLEHETDQADQADDRHERDGQATSTNLEPTTAVGSDLESSPAPATLSDTSPSASTAGLHEDVAQHNRASKLAVNSKSHIPTSSDEKENDGPARKPKRRLTLHDAHPQQQKKKRKVALKQTVQTTLALAIGGNPGMRECKVCDTVYNPFHPEDVKVHAKRHAGVVRKERRSLEV